MKPLLEEISEYLSIANLSDKTKQRYRKLLVEFAEFLADLLNCRIHEVELEKFYYIPYDEREEKSLFLQIDACIVDDYFERNISKGYSWLAYTKSSLSSLFKYLSLNYNFKNVMYNLEFKLQDHKQPVKSRRILNRQEILKLMWSIIKFSQHVERDALLFITLFTTGCRINELLKLKWEDIHVNDEMFFLRETKNKRQKFIVTRIGLTRVFELYCLKNEIGKEDYIFTDGSSKPLTQNKVRLLLNDFLYRVNIPPAGVHSTRRSFATIMYENGSDINVIQQLLNHVTINSTKVYINENYVRNVGLHIPVYEEIFKNLKEKIRH